MKFIFHRKITRIVIRCWVWWLYWILEYRLLRYRREQTMLAQRYEISNSKIETYSDVIRIRISDLASVCREAKDFAWTSGTMNKPKQIFYPKHRLRKLQRIYIEQVVLAYKYLGLDKPAFYFFTNMSADNSVSNLLCREPLPRILANLVLSDSIVFMPEIAQLTSKYRQETLHLAMLLLSQPSLLATANPSSIYILMEQVRTDWSAVGQQLAKIFQELWVTELRKKLGPDVDLRMKRVKQLINQPQSPQIQELFPELKVIYCWDGGYVQPFIDNVKSQFAPISLQFFPMFSLSTETVAYLIYPGISTQGGLPIYCGVCYEFVSTGLSINEANILKPWELKEGYQYTMLISDAYGFKRYHTEDIFECLGFKYNTPILQFIGRIGLNYSFTGEKITDKQLLQVYQNIRDVIKISEIAFTCFPKLNQGSVPGYVFVCIMDKDTTGLLTDISAEMIDQALMEINEEYTSKRKSNRLAKPEIVVQNYKQFVDKLRNYNHCSVETSSAQFKVLPLYKIFWEDLNERKEQL